MRGEAAMTSDLPESAFDTPDTPDELPDAAPEADVVEQHQSPSGYDDRDRELSDLPVEADPADVEEQRQVVEDDDLDDYR
jgi:hypothetical protein